MQVNVPHSKWGQEQDDEGGEQKCPNDMRATKARTGARHRISAVCRRHERPWARAHHSAAWRRGDSRDSAALLGSDLVNGEILDAAGRFIALRPCGSQLATHQRWGAQHTGLCAYRE